MRRAIFFDLDDTLFDQQHAARAALTAVHGCHACFAGQTLDALETAHSRLLEALHVEILAGRIGLDAAREERFRRLFAQAGAPAAPDVVSAAARMYRSEYLAARRAIDGAAALLTRLRASVRVGIVTNNMRDEQVDKLRHCRLDALVDELVTSEEAGFSKPDPFIFHVALERLGCAPAEALMVGDSWEADVEGARAAGIPVVWFNRRGRPAPAPGVPELRALEPPDRIASWLLSLQG